MSNVKTTTTSFKKALKTVTDTLTASEQKMYDVALEIEYTGDEGSITMEHPINGMYVTANFKGEKYGDIYHVTFYIGDLVDKLKPFRRKETLYLDIGMDTFVLSSEEGIVFETALEGSGYKIPTFKETYLCNRKKIIEILRIGQAVTKTSFHASTMALHLVASANKLHVKATNFSLVSISEVNLVEGLVEKPFEVTLSAKEITKVRNVLERGTGKYVSFGKYEDYFLLETDSTSVIFKDEEEITHLNVNKIIKNQKWQKVIYTLNTEIATETVKEQYDKLRTAEDEKDEDGIEISQCIHLVKHNDYKELKFSKELHDYHVNTRDMHSVMNRLPVEMQVAFSKKAIMLNYKDDDYKTMLLVPILTNE